MLPEKFNEKFILLDGAMGTMIQQKVMPEAKIPELYNLLAPETMISIHKEYVDAGSDVIYANTFGANALKFRNLDASLGEVIEAGIRNAKKAAEGTDTLVALDIGPLGQLLEPMGTLTFEEAYEAFAEVVRTGSRAGADLIVIETMTDLYETKAALLAAKENSDLPVLVSMTFEENGRTFTGCSLEAMVLTLESLGADAIGINCSLGPAQLAPLLERLCQLSSLPILAKPNAGLPDPRTGHYHLSPEEFGKAAEAYIDAGVTILGGCCGTTPETIRVLASLIKNRKPSERHIHRIHGITSPLRTVSTEHVCVVGERINPTGKKRFAQALLENDLDYIAKTALEQKDAGADILDVNVGYPGIDEKTMLPAVVKKIQSVCDLPLLLDSSDPQAIENALRVVDGKAAVNSVNGKEESLRSVLPVAARYGACLVALCLDEKGIPETAGQRIEIAKRIIEKAEKAGIDQKDLWIDALTLTVSAQQSQAKETLDALSWANQQGIPTILGVSNISFGLPYRTLMTRTFLNAALARGLRLPIINPNSEALMETVQAFRVLNGEDQDCRNYVRLYAGRKEASGQTARSHGSACAAGPAKAATLEDCIVQGLDKQAADQARDLLKAGELTEIELAEKMLIPALDRVGGDYEKGILYLPQLLSSAQAAQSVFEVLKESMAGKGSSSLSKGKIVLATVKGDIHDIGKNIVKTLLENYGYQVIDLGKDVDPQLVLDTVVEEQVPLVGLSALMTTTVPSMEETIRLLHTLEHPPIIMVGGAVLTEDAAREIKADYYAKDAKASVEIARKVFGQ